MDVVFHALFVWPIQILVEFLYLILNQWSGLHVGVTVVLLSLAVNTLLLPLYLVADRWQKEEKQLLQTMMPKLAQIRAVFQGDERQMMISTYYRQRGYHPLLSLRSSIGLLMQIPFFLGAYLVLSHANGLKVPVSIIQDFSLPDHLLRWGGHYINVLPLVMTAINILSALVYAKNLRARDNVQLFVLAGIFLILLYDSPAGLVLYWTINNLFSLAKNLVLQMRRPGRVYHALMGATVLVLELWSLSVRHFSLGWLVETVAALAIVAAAPFGWKKLTAVAGGTEFAPKERLWFHASGGFLFLLSGLAIPVLFVSASPGEVAGGWPQVFRTTLQMFSLFVLLPAGLWALASPPARRLLCWGMAVLAVSAAVFAFAFPPQTSFNASFTVTDPQGLVEANGGWLTALVLGGAVLLVSLVVVFRRPGWATAGLGLGSVSLLLVSAITALSLPPPPARSEQKAVAATKVSPVFHLTRKGQNQVLIFIDGFPAPALPEMLEGLPGFRDSLEGFTWYANTLSYSGHTLQNTPPLLGGPAYTPDAINARVGVPLKVKHAEALTTLPKLLGSQGERVVLSDPWYIDFDGDRSAAAFQGEDNVSTVNLHGTYTDLYFRQHPYHVESSPVVAFDYDILGRFSAFRMAPPAWRSTLYNDGGWWIVSTDAHISDFVTGGYPNLVFFPELYQVDDGPNAATFFFNEVFHDSGAFDRQGQLQTQQVEVPASDQERYGNVYSARNIYDGRAILAQVQKWMGWLKEQGLYDQTRILIVSDHGHPLSEARFGPNPWFRPLILFKDYGDRAPLKTDDVLKTVADVPGLLTKGMPGAIPLRPKDDVPAVHDGPFMPEGQRPDSYVFTKTWKLSRPDSRVLENWTTE